MDAQADLSLHLGHMLEGMLSDMATDTYLNMTMYLKIMSLMKAIKANDCLLLLDWVFIYQLLSKFGSDSRAIHI